MSIRSLAYSLYSFYETNIQKRNTLRYLDEQHKVEWQSSEQIAALQWQRLQALLAHAEKNVPYYTDMFKKLGINASDIRTMDDFRKLPVMGRPEVVAHQPRMEATNFQGQLMRKATGGSTGVPVQLALNRESYERRTAATQRGYGWANCDISHHTLYIWSVDVGKKPLSYTLKNKLYHKLLNREMFNCFDFGEDEMRRCVAYINEKKPTGIVSYTTSIYNLAKFIKENNVKLDRSAVKGIITGAERLFDYQREMIEDVFGIKVFNSYGCREFMLIAMECDHHKGLHLNSDNLLVEVLVDGRPAQPGETGEIVITDLHNYGMPFIRYKNGDMATAAGENCSCGRGFPLVRDIDGRKLDLITAWNGKKVTGVFFPHLLKEVKEIAKFQVVQKVREELEVKIVQKTPLGEDKINFLRNEMQHVMGPEVAIKFTFVDDIPLNATGKYRVTISELKD